MSIRDYQGLKTNVSSKLPGDYCPVTGGADLEKYTTAIKDGPRTDAKPKRVPCVRCKLHKFESPDPKCPVCRGSGKMDAGWLDEQPLTDHEIRKRAEWQPGSVHPAAEIVSAEWSGRILTITVPGVPVAKPRMTRRDRWAKRSAVMRYREFADRLRAVSASAPAHAEKVLSLVVIAYFAPPKSWSREKRTFAIDQLHRVKPDASNILKGIEDILWPRGDSAIADSRCVKRWWYEPSLEIRIEI